MRKWLLILLLAIPLIHAGLLRSPEPVDASGDVVLATGQVTLANTKLSLADSYAFFDFSTDMTPWIGETIEICPATAASKHYCIRGLVSSLGTGETLGGDLISTNRGTFSDGLTTGVACYPNNTCVAEDQGGGDYALKMTYVDYAAGGYTYLIPPFATVPTVKCLHKYCADTKVSSGASVSFSIYTPGPGSLEMWTETQTTFQNHCFYTTSAPTWYVRLATNFGSGEVFYIDNIVLKQVLTPSTTGHWIKKSAASTTDGDAWSQNSASFMTNDSAGYYYRIIKAKQSGSLVASGALTSSNVRLSTVDAGAMVEISGVDLSQYAGGDDNASLPCRWKNPYSTSGANWRTNRYLLALYDSAGKVATGYIGGPGAGIAVGSDVLSGWDFTSDWSGDACAATVSDADTFAISASSGCVYKTYSALDTGTLYYATLVGTPSAGTLSLRGNSSEPIWCSGNTCTGYGTATTNTNDKVLVYNSSGGVGATADITSMTLQPVTDISTTGVHLHSTPNGYDRKMARKDSGFNPNGVTSYKIYKIGTGS